MTMTNPFNELKAPKRSEQEIDNTFKQIEKKIVRNKRRTVWQNSGLLVAIAAILLFFIASNTLPLSNQTAAGASDIQSIYYIDTIITDNFDEIEKWYYINTVKIRGKQFEIASQLVNRVNRGEKLPGTVNSHPQSDAFIVKYNDGTVRKYQVETNTGLSTLNLVNISTSQFTEFTPEEYSVLIYEPKGWPIYVKMILDGIAIFIYFSYLWIAQKLSPNIRYHFERTSKLLLKLVGLWIFMGTLQYLTLAFFSGINILFSAAVIAVVFVGRLLKEYYDGQFKRNVLEVPFSIVIYIIIFFLLNVQ